MTQLERECRVFARYLSGQDASPYLLEKYSDFHQKMEASLGRDPFDDFLVRTASRGTLWAACADSYSRLFRPTCALRKKLILVLALLECAPPSFEVLDNIPAGGFIGAMVRLAATSAKFIAASVAGAVLFTPARAWISSRER
jgi:hypothetical protein